MSKKVKSIPPSPVVTIAGEFSQFHQSRTNKLIHYFTIPFLSFAVLGLIWAIPFPHLDFLGGYNGFINWASFVIAGAVYYYYRVSQVLSYGLLVMVFAFSAGIVGLEKLHTLQGWPEMWQICLLISAVCYAAQFSGHKVEGRVPPPVYSLKTFVNGPLWMSYLLFKRAGLKF